MLWKKVGLIRFGWAENVSTKMFQQQQQQQQHQQQHQQQQQQQQSKK
jgi:hypothetical protein